MSMDERLNMRGKGKIYGEVHTKKSMNSIRLLIEMSENIFKVHRQKQRNQKLLYIENCAKKVKSRYRPDQEKIMGPFLDLEKRSDIGKSNQYI